MFGILAICGASVSSAQAAVVDTGAAKLNADLIGAIAEQQRAIEALQSVLSQQLVVQQETLATLRQIQVAQTSGGQKQ